MANITYIRIGDEVYGLHDDNALTSNSNLNASKVVGTLPANTYTNTTYENKAAVEGGTDVSLVTTGDKYRWNNTSSSGVSDVEVNGSSVVSGGVAEITVPTKTSDLTNDSNFQNATQVDTAINSRIASVYKAKGSIAFASLPALTSSNEGFVYDINESFTTTSDFVEGAGATYPAGTNVVIIDIGNGIYKYDVLAGVIDLSGKQDKLISGFNIKKINNQSILGSGNIGIETPQNVCLLYIDEGNKCLLDENSNLVSIADILNILYSQDMSIVVASQNSEVIFNMSILNNNPDFFIYLYSADYVMILTYSGVGSEYWDNLTQITFASDTQLQQGLSQKQNTLVSGTNIKTINNQSLLGSGNISIQSGSDQIFIATPDVTSYAELDEAISNDQLICIVTSTGEILPCSCGYVNVSTNPPIFLSYQEVASTRLSRYTISMDNNWSLGTTDLQSKLVSGTNIKTINNQSVLGSGNIDVSYDLTATDDGAGTVTLSLNS